MLTDQALIDIAGIIGESGTCSRLQVGAVLTVDRRIISTGYNGAPAGMPHCAHIMVHPDGTETIVGLEDGTLTCIFAVHAEANVIAFAARHGVNTFNSVLYTTNSPCITCARLLINAGVKEVIFEHQYRDLSGIRELEIAGVTVTGPYGPGLSTMSTPRGDPKGMYPGERTHPGFEDTETADPTDFDRRGPGL